MSGFTRKVVATEPRREDLEIHVSQIEAEGVKYIEIREFVASLGMYGRGILVPADKKKWLVDAILKTR